MKSRVKNMSFSILSLSLITLGLSACGGSSDKNDASSIALTTNTQSIATARENNQVTGQIEDRPIAGIGFKTGVPQAVMKNVIANHTTEDAPSPLGELYWSWASGYRNFVMNFSITNAAGDAGEGYIHLGSRGCGSESPQALSDKETCDLVNTPSVMLDGFDPAINTINVNIDEVLSNLTFVAPILSEEEHFDVIGEGPGVACHSAPVELQPDCESIFENFGIRMSDGTANADSNRVFQFE